MKYEDIYLKKYSTLPELAQGLTSYFIFYNGERGHQSLGYQTPDTVYRTGLGGGAKILDHYGDARETSSVSLRCTGDVSRVELGQQHSAVV